MVVFICVFRGHCMGVGITLRFICVDQRLSELALEARSEVTDLLRFCPNYSHNEPTLIASLRTATGLLGTLGQCRRHG